MGERYFRDEDVANLLGISVSRLRVKITYGEPLPDRIQAPGCKHRLWLKQKVFDWLDRHSVSSGVEKSGIRRVSRK